MIERVRMVLEAIPCDRWVSAAEIAAETGISSRVVAGIIRTNLNIKYVERKTRRMYERGSYLYRRLRFVGENKEVGG